MGDVYNDDMLLELGDVETEEEEADDLDVDDEDDDADPVAGVADEEEM